LRNKHLLILSCGIVLCAPLLAQQASITLLNSDVAYCYKQDTPWTINKTNDQTDPVLSNAIVNWTITATKGNPGPKQLCVNGVVTVSNTGTANATIGNVIVDIQRSQTGVNKWKVLSADVADSTNGDSATTDKMAASAMASQTDYSGVATVSASTATFTENAASGSLEFTDATSNTVWAISPQQTIAPGSSVTLLFKAVFNGNNIFPALNPGELLRTEVLVSFGNSGARGGSGASATNIDINGNTAIDPDELNVRTVPTRLTYPVPPLQICNDSVTITDTFTTNGTAGVSNVTGNDPGTGTLISASTTFTVTGTVTGDGVVTNTAKLDGTDSTVTTLLSFNTFPCCVGLHLQDTSSVTVYTTSVPAKQPTYCSYSRNEYLHNGAGNGILLANFASTFMPANFTGKPPCPSSGACTLSGLTIGNPTGSAHATWSNEAKFETAINGGGSDGALSANDYNATSISGGKFPLNVAALTLNVTMNGVGTPTSPSIGNLYYNNPGDFFHGKTVSQILAAANATLATGVLPDPTYSFNKFDALIDQLNQAWNKCKSNALVNQGALTVTQPQ